MKNKKILILILTNILLMTNIAFSQILNSSFENWADGQPTNWTGVNGLVTNVVQSTDAYDGAYSVKMEIVEFIGLPWPASFYSISDNSTGFQIFERYSRLKGFIKADLKGSSVFWGGVTVYSENQQAIAGGNFFIRNSSADWEQFEAFIDYSSNEAPAYVSINFNLLDSLGSDLTAVGTNVKIDKLSFDIPTSVEANDNTPLTFSLDQNYPNPFNPSTTIRYNIPNESEVSLAVYNAVGAKVADLYSGSQSAGNFEINWNASDLSSGVYFLRMNAISFQNSKSFTDVKKLILLK